MGAEMYFRKKTSSGRAYLQIVESRRDPKPKIPGQYLHTAPRTSQASGANPLPNPGNGAKKCPVLLGRPTPLTKPRRPTRG